MDLDVFVTPGLGDSSYLLRSGDEAVLVDPQRDAWRFLAAAESLGVRVRAVLETHVHNDYVSGAHEVRAATGADLVLPARGGYEFAHRGADEGYEVSVGDLRLTAMATPGHTPEHLSWLVGPAGGDPTALFSGGSLLMGSAGRTDLLGPGYTGELTRAQYASIQRLSGLPDDVRVLPTHGPGSFCVAAMPSTRASTTIGEERRRNPLLRVADLAGFDAELSGELMAYPAYYAQMAPINRSGPPVLGRLPEPPALDAAAVERARREGVWIVDGRDRAAFAAAHVPGSVNIELNSGFASYVGWLLPFAAPLVLILPDPQDESLTEAVTQLIRIGWDRIAGHLRGGLDAWRAAGGELSSYPVVDVEDLCRAQRGGERPVVLDVRQELEWAWGGVPGARQVFLADLPARMADLSRTEPAWVLCSNGHRAAIAASLLDRAGVPARLVAEGGVGEWRSTCRDLARR
jgi:hydroxyacylglutathione hydrolase